MAYRTDISNRDRGRAIAAAFAIQAALLLAFLHMSGKIDLRDTQTALSTLNLINRPPAAQQQRQQQKPKEKQGSSAPQNVRSRATAVVAPRPQVETPPVQRIVASATPQEGPTPTQGASDLRGPGTGAGGAGNGTGSGDSGNGLGGDGIAEPPRLASPVLEGRDFPADLLDQWPLGATVFLRLRVDARGNVAECVVDRGTGNPRIDAIMCNIAHDRLRFRPAMNRSGQAVAGWFGYAQPSPR